MSIKFACRCGKRLRVADDWAGRRFPCPACGSPVGVPSREKLAAVETEVPLADGPATLEPREVEGPVLFRLRRGTQAAAALDAPWVPVEGALLPPPEERTRQRERKRRRSWRMEERWYESLAYPAPGWPILLALAIGLAYAAGAFLQAWLQRLGLPATTAPIYPVGVQVGFALGILLYVAAVLDAILVASMSGDSRYLPWPGANLLRVLRSNLLWALCFLAGPIVPAGLALWYWLNCGDPTPIDGLILGELSVAAVGHWLLARCAVAESGRLSDLVPGSVLRMGYRLGPIGFWSGVAAVVVGWLHLRWLSGALTLLHVDPVAAYPLLTLLIASALYAAIVVLRIVGLGCFRTRSREVGEANIAAIGDQQEPARTLD